MENENVFTPEVEVTDPIPEMPSTQEVAAAPEVAVPETPAVPEAPVVKRCVRCQAVLAEGQNFCAECGTAQKKTCPQCGAGLEDGQRFCAGCGFRLDVAPMPQPMPIQEFNANLDAQQAKKKRSPLKIIAIVAAVVIVLAIISNMGGGDDLNDMFSEYAHESWCEIASDGSWMRLDTNPYDLDDHLDSDAVDAVEEANDKLGFSGAVYQRMLKTRAMDGVQTAESDNYTASWTYHPDEGLEVMYECK